MMRPTTAPRDRAQSAAASLSRRESPRPLTDGATRMPRNQASSSPSRRAWTTPAGAPSTSATSVRWVGPSERTQSANTDGR